jgi:reverse gyrase
MADSEKFAEFFQAATGCEPFDYQRRLAGGPTVADAVVDGPKSLAINVLTGAGKTGAAVRMVVPRSAVEAGASVRGRCGRQ